jgi:hypothetical protein
MHYLLDLQVWGIVCSNRRQCLVHSSQWNSLIRLRIFVFSVASLPLRLKYSLGTVTEQYCWPSHFSLAPLLSLIGLVWRPRPISHWIEERPAALPRMMKCRLDLTTEDRQNAV